MHNIRAHGIKPLYSEWTFLNKQFLLLRLFWTLNLSPFTTYNHIMCTVLSAFSIIFSPFSTDFYQQCGPFVKTLFTVSRDCVCVSNRSRPIQQSSCKVSSIRKDSGKTHTISRCNCWPRISPRFVKVVLFVYLFSAPSKTSTFFIIIFIFYNTSKIDFESLHRGWACFSRVHRKISIMESLFITGWLGTFYGSDW